MPQQHSSHAQMSPQMERHHYKMLALNLMVSLVIMYLVMFTMIWSFSEFFNNLNMLYMTLMMVTPMGVLMLLMMGSMYRNRRWTSCALTSSRPRRKRSSRWRGCSRTMNKIE